MRKIPGLGPVVIERPDPVMMAHYCSALAALGPAAAGHVGKELRTEGGAIHARAGEDVVRIGFLRTSVYHVAALIERSVLV